MATAFAFIEPVILSPCLKALGVARKAMLWTVEQATFGGKRLFASVAIDLLNARYMPRRSVAVASRRSVVVLPVPANALILRAPPSLNLATASACSGVGVIQRRSNRDAERRVRGSLCEHGYEHCISRVDDPLDNAAALEAPIRCQFHREPLVACVDAEHTCAVSRASGHSGGKS